MKTHNPFKNIFTDCPPESPHQLYVNSALYAVGEAHGAFMNDLSEPVAQLVINAATTAAYAALEAAHVGDAWIDVAQAPHPAPVLVADIITGPISVYQALAWAYQAQMYPRLFNDAYNEAYQAALVETIDAMLKFALTAASVADAWDRLYTETLERIHYDR